METDGLLDPEAVPPGHRSGYVSLIGAPNAGKSTLMNSILGRKLSIVTRRASTTRHRILGILSADNYQALLFDTPGVVRPQYRLHDLMMHEVQRAVADADVLLFLADATREEPDNRALDMLLDKPAIIVLTKMDLIRREDALPLVERYSALRAFDAVVPVSAVKGYNLDALVEETVSRLPPGPPLYPKDQLSEHPERFFVAEIVREALFDLFKDEIPYASQVNVVEYRENPEGKDFIDCEIVVERDSQKAIVIGRGGTALKRLGAAARTRIEEFLERPVYLQLHVKARADWRNKEGMLRSFGYGPS